MRKKWPKNDRSKKCQNTKKSVASYPSTRGRNFWILFMLPFNFHDWFLKLWAVISRSRKNNWLKSLFMVGTLVGLMWSWIIKNWMTSSAYHSKWRARISIYYGAYQPTFVTHSPRTDKNHKNATKVESEPFWKGKRPS